MTLHPSGRLLALACLLTGLEAPSLHAQTGQMVANVNPAGPSSPYSVAAVGGRVYFTADDGVHGFEPWVYDWATGGAALLADINPGSANSHASEFTALGGRVYFRADGPDAGFDVHLWEFDPGTGVVGRVPAVFNAGIYGPFGLTVIGGTLVFKTPVGWVYSYRPVSNTLATIVSVFDNGPSRTEFHPAEHAGRLYFSHENRLWKYDPIDNNASRVEVLGLPTEFFPRWLVFIGENLYFSASVGGETELYAYSTRTWQGALAADLNPSGSSSPADLVVGIDGLYLSTHNPGRSLWFHDPNTGVTSELLGSAPTADRYSGDIYDVAIHEGEVWFTSLYAPPPPPGQLPGPALPTISAFRPSTGSFRVVVTDLSASTPTWTDVPYAFVAGWVYYGGRPEYELFGTEARPVASDPAWVADVAVQLAPPRPNPTPDRTSVRYVLPEAGPVRVAVSDALGREVAVLVDGERSAGTHDVTLNAGRLALGVYLVRLTTISQSLTRQLTVMR